MSMWKCSPMVERWSVKPHMGVQFSPFPLTIKIKKRGKKK